VTALGIATLLLVGAALLPLVKSGRWWIRFCDFPRVPLVLLSAAALAWWGLLPVEDLLLKAAAMLSLVGALVVHGVQMVPFSRLHPKESLAPRQSEYAAEGRVRLLVSNVLMTNRHSDGMLRLARSEDPDLLLLLEPDERWSRELETLHQAFPHRVEVPLDNTYGMILFSKLELQDPEVRYLVDEGVPSIRTRVRLRDGRRFELYCLHPVPPDVAQDTTERDAELVMVGREVAKTGAASIVTGDLNDVAWSHTTRLFRRLSGLLDPRIGRGLFSTFPAGAPTSLLRYPLDHVFHSKEFRLERMSTLRAPGSDHLAVSATLLYQPEGQAAQDAPERDADDRREAREILEEEALGEPRSPTWRR